MLDEPWGALLRLMDLECIANFPAMFDADVMALDALGSSPAVTTFMADPLLANMTEPKG